MLVLFLGCLILTSCISAKKNSLSIDTIEFGSGGGITGRYTTYTVDLKQGVILKPDGSTKRKLEKKEIKSITKKLKETDFSKVEFNYPHNMSYFINFTGEINTKIVWGDQSHPAPEKVKELYTFLIELIKQ